MKTPILKFKQLVAITAISCGGINGVVTPVNALTFNFSSQDTALQTEINTPSGSASQQALAVNGFKSAGNLWSSLFTDNVTVNIDIGFKNLNTPTSTTRLANASSATGTVSYQSFYTSLAADKSSADDITAVKSLPTGSTFKMLINLTSNVGGSGNFYLDNDGGANNQTVDLTSANAKALGLLTSSSALDASIVFNDQFIWDFDRSNGISAGAYDFVGIAAHEIGHTLGFISGVDTLDTNDYSLNPQDDNYFTNVTPLDLFRYSLDSRDLHAIDFTADSEDKYFSIDGGATKIASLSTGVVHGNGRQTGHWDYNAGLGIMDPTFVAGQLASVTSNDVQAFDAIGWNRSAAADAMVPEPSNVVGTLLCAVFGAKFVLKRRKQIGD